MIFEMNDKNVRKAFLRYSANGDLSHFVREAGVWIMSFARLRLKASDDESSEIFFYFYEKQKKIPRWLQLANPKNILMILALNTRNILSNIRRKKNSDQEEREFLKLWDQERQEQEERASGYARYLVQKVLRRQSPLSRIIFSLHYNISLSPKDSRILEKISRKRFPDPQNFRKETAEREYQILEKEKILLQRINYYNRRIYRKKNYEYKMDSQVRKKQLMDSLCKKEELFSAKEIGVLFQMSRYKVGKICKKIQEELKLEFLKIHHSPDLNSPSPESIRK